MDYLPATTAIAADSSASAGAERISGFLPPGGIDPAAANSAVGSTPFGQLVSDGLGKVNQQLVGSQQDLQRLALGDAQNLHQIMIQLEETRMSFQLMMQVRTRLLEAYQDVMKMPI